MKLAAKFRLPIICLIDTPGAYPGIGAEERGQASSIAVNLRELSLLRTPMVCVVIGEGGSGGALGIGVGDHVAMLQFAYYSVISPEGCAGILWKDGRRADQAARALKFTSADLLRMQIVDEVIREPLGGAHRDHGSCRSSQPKRSCRDATRSFASSGSTRSGQSKRQWRRVPRRKAAPAPPRAPQRTTATAAESSFVADPGVAATSDNVCYVKFEPKKLREKRALFGGA
jgi:acetyl-CoA carboxylase carboxyl transferase alpha subunit